MKIKIERPTAGRSGRFWLQPIRPDQQGIAGIPDAWSVDRIPPATKILAGLVSSDSLAAGINEIHPWLRDLPSDDQFRLLEDACAAIPDAVWSDSEPWRVIIAGLRGLHHLDQ
jgi:hypothetical protein